MRVRVGGAWKEVASARVYVGGAWRTLVEARAYVSSAWETIANFVPDLTVSVSPPGASGSTSGAGAVTTNSVTATPSGGKGPYTYAWTRILGNASTVTSPASATTTFQRFMPPGEEAAETWRVTVTDNLGTAASADIIASFISFDTSDGSEP